MWLRKEDTQRCGVAGSDDGGRGRQPGNGDLSPRNTKASILPTT